MAALVEVPSDLPATLRVLDRDQAAAVLGISTRCLDGLAADGEGPAVVKIGRRVLYRLADLEAFLAERVTGAGV